MAITKILGFIRDEEDLKVPSWTQSEVKEVVRVITDTASDHSFDIVADLPSYASGPGTTDFNPLQLTFTLYQSTHPHASGLVLLEAQSVRRVPKTGNAWDITLLYGTYIPFELQAYNNGTGTPITNPLLQPVVWSSSTSIVQKQTYTKPNGSFILHEHGMMINDPVTHEEAHTTHTWNFNVDYASLNYFSQFASLVGKVGSTTTFGTDGQYWKLTTCSANEARESFGSGATRYSYHYVKITITFEYNPSGWVDDAKLVSRSTKQKLDGDFIPININGNGDRAHEPWPLLPVDGGGDVLGAPYDDLDPNDFAVLDTGYPVTANIATLISTYGLAIP